MNIADKLTTHQELLHWAALASIAIAAWKISAFACRALLFKRVREPGFPSRPAIYKHRTRDWWLVRGKILNRRRAPMAYAAARFLRSVMLLALLALAATLLDAPELAWLKGYRPWLGGTSLALLVLTGDRNMVLWLGKLFLGVRFSILRTPNMVLMVTSKYGAPFWKTSPADSSTEVTGFTEKISGDDFRVVLQVGSYNPVTALEVHGERDAKLVSNAVTGLAELQRRSFGYHEDRIKKLNTRNFENARSTARAE